jgi:excisionase family DNA binding protein
MRRELEPALNLARTLAAAELPEFLGELECIRVSALARLSPHSQEQERADRLLDVNEAANCLHCSPEYLYRNHRRLPFTRREGRKLLFSSNELDKYLKRKSR